MTPAIVVMAYERPEALRRLLQSIERAHYPPLFQVPLVISLDRSTTPSGARTAAIAGAFGWPWGPKVVLEREEHLGVVGHFRQAGRLAEDYGSAILLEDDLTVAPSFYDFAVRVLDVYSRDDRVAGCCLYGLWFNGFTLEPFHALEDGADVFFLGVPHTQGLCFSAAQWAAFDPWWRKGEVAEHPRLHPAFLRFGRDEWFPSLAAYLAQSGRYFCFPRVSQTAGWGDAGAHFDQGTSWFQTPLQFGRSDYRLPDLDASLAVYDGFFEIDPERLKRLAPALAAYDFDTDLNATKQQQHLNRDLVLTSRPVRDAILRFGLEMIPAEANVVTGVTGEVISLAHRDAVRWDKTAEVEARGRLHAYAWRRFRSSRRRSLKFAAAHVAGWLRARLPQRVQR